MGAVVSCLSNALRTIGRTIMAIIRGIGGILMAIINGVVTFLGIIVGFLTCQGCGSRKGHSRRKFGSSRHHSTRTSTI